VHDDAIVRRQSNTGGEFRIGDGAGAGIDDLPGGAVVGGEGVADAAAAAAVRVRNGDIVGAGRERDAGLHGVIVHQFFAGGILENAVLIDIEVKTPLGVGIEEAGNAG